MRVAKVLSTSITATALVFSMLASAFPAAAAGGFNAAYFSESSFLSLAPGQSGQFAVGFSNTGTQAWVKGSATAQASLRMRANTSAALEAWSVNWPATRTYANQANDLVAPGQVGFFIYNVQVPANQPTGAVDFTGVPFGGNDFMEDYGYYQTVTVTASAITITGSSPASPSTTTTPTISGTGATATTIVTVQEGSTTLCTATASSTGTWSCTVSALSVGSHAITATAPSQGTSAVFTYVVDTAAPALASVTTTSNQQLTVCYDKAMTSAGPFSAIDARSYELVPAISSVTAVANVSTTLSLSSATSISADKKCVLFILTGTNQLADDTSYTLTVGNTGITGGVADAAGNKLAAGATIAFSTDDSTAPQATGVTLIGTRSFVLQFSEPMLNTTLTAANLKWDSASFPGTIFVRNSNATGNITHRNAQVRLSLATGGSPVSTSAGAHTLDVWDVTDLGGNTISPNPTSFTITISDDTTRPTATATAFKSNSGSTAAYTANPNASVGTNAGYIQGVTVTFSEAMQASTGGWASASGSTNSIDNMTNYTIFNPDGSAATVGCASGSGTALSANPNGYLQTASTDARFQLKAITLYWNTLFGNGCAYTLQVSNVQDQAGNTTGVGNGINPNPTLLTVTDSLDTAAFTVTSATASLTQLSVCFNKSLSSSKTSVTAPTQTQTAYTTGTANTTASTPTNFTSTGTALGNSMSTSGSSASGASFDGLSNDVLCTRFRFDENLTAGTYTLTVSGITDGAGNTLTPNPTTIQVSYSDSTAPALSSSARGSVTNFTVTYSKAMTGGSGAANSAGNPNNYSLNNGTFGNLCGNGTPVITTTSAGLTFTITCTVSSGTAYTSDITSANATSGIVPTTGTVTITTRNVADTNGNVISPNPQSKPIA